MQKEPTLTKTSAQDVDSMVEQCAEISDNEGSQPPQVSFVLSRLNQLRVQPKQASSRMIRNALVTAINSNISTKPLTRHGFNDSNRLSPSSQIKIGISDGSAGMHDPSDNLDDFIEIEASEFDNNTGFRHMNQMDEDNALMILYGLNCSSFSRYDYLDPIEMDVSLLKPPSYRYYRLFTRNSSAKTIDWKMFEKRFSINGKPQAFFRALLVAQCEVLDTEVVKTKDEYKRINLALVALKAFRRLDMRYFTTLNTVKAMKHLHYSIKLFSMNLDEITDMLTRLPVYGLFLQYSLLMQLLILHTELIHTGVVDPALHLVDEHFVDYPKEQYEEFFDKWFYLGQAISILLFYFRSCYQRNCTLPLLEEAFAYYNATKQIIHLLERQRIRNGSLHAGQGCPPLPGKSYSTAVLATFEELDPSLNRSSVDSTPPYSNTEISLFNTTSKSNNIMASMPLSDKTDVLGVLVSCSKTGTQLNAHHTHNRSNASQCCQKSMLYAIHGAQSDTESISVDTEQRSAELSSPVAIVVDRKMSGDISADGMDHQDGKPASDIANSIMNPGKFPGTFSQRLLSTIQDSDRHDVPEQESNKSMPFLRKIKSRAKLERKSNANASQKSLHSFWRRRGASSAQNSSGSHQENSSSIQGTQNSDIIFATLQQNVTYHCQHNVCPKCLDRINGILRILRHEWKAFIATAKEINQREVSMVPAVFPEILDL